MKVIYKDPWELPQEIVIPEGDEEALREVLDFCNENARLIRNADRRERYHIPYRLEAMEYEGETLAYRLDPEVLILLEERNAVIRDALQKLTDVQYRRVYLRFYGGMNYRQIAAAERAAVNAVRDSIEAALKKMRPALEKYFPELL